MRFLRLLTRPPLRPFMRLARRLASLRTRPPSLPSATAWGFLRFRFITALHSIPPEPTNIERETVHCYPKRFALLLQIV